VAVLAVSVAVLEVFVTSSELIREKRESAQTDQAWHFLRDFAAQQHMRFPTAVPTATPPPRSRVVWDACQVPPLPQLALSGITAQSSDEDLVRAVMESVENLKGAVEARDTALTACREAALNALSDR
jgi:hypothetical protein